MTYPYLCTYSFVSICAANITPTYMYRFKLNHCSGSLMKLGFSSFFDYSGLELGLTEMEHRFRSNLARIRAGNSGLKIREQVDAATRRGKTTVKRFRSCMQTGSVSWILSPSWRKS